MAGVGKVTAWLLVVEFTGMFLQTQFSMHCLRSLSSTQSMSNSRWWCWTTKLRVAKEFLRLLRGVETQISLWLQQLFNPLPSFFGFLYFHITFIIWRKNCLPKGIFTAVPFSPLLLLQLTSFLLLPLIFLNVFFLFVRLAHFHRKILWFHIIECEYFAYIFFVLVSAAYESVCHFECGCGMKFLDDLALRAHREMELFYICWKAYFIDVYSNQRLLIDWTTPALPLQEPVDNEHDSSFESMEESMEDVMLQEQPRYSLRHLEEQPTLCQPTHVQGENEQGEQLKFDTKCLLVKNQALGPSEMPKSC